jgi:NitT/TauT family transport system substrate-binding protein
VTDNRAELLSLYREFFLNASPLNPARLVKKIRQNCGRSPLQLLMKWSCDAAKTPCPGAQLWRFIAISARPELAQTLLRYYPWFDFYYYKREKAMRPKAIYGVLVSACLALSAGAQPATAAGLKIGYSDWPGWVAMEVGINKGWFKDAGIDVTFQWFDYSASMDAFAAGKIDGDLVTNGDALVTGAGGAKGIMVLLTDYSNGNDMIVGKPGIKSLKDLKGKKVGIEIGLVEHLLLLQGLQDQGMSASDVTLVNAKTNETPQVLASGQVDAIGAWQPNSGQAMKALPGSKPIYTSAQAPGLIYDVLYATPTSVAAHKADYIKLAQVWDKIVHYINDPATQDDAVKILSARVGLTPQAYKPLLKGTHLIDIAEGKKIYVKAKGLGSLYGSTDIANDFNVKNAVYKESQATDAYIDPSITSAVK